MTKSEQNTHQLTRAQYWGFIILRMIIGWHFLYEGIVKLMNPEWSAEDFLVNSRGFLSGLFHWMASQSAVLEAVNTINVWGLILIGLGLLMGILARPAVYAGIVLLFLYYIAYPPVRGYSFGVPQEGHYLLVNKNLIELAVLLLLALFPRPLDTGLWSLLKKIKLRVRIPSSASGQKTEPSVAAGDLQSRSRREMIRDLAFLPLLGAFSWAFVSNRKYIPSRAEADAITGSTIKLNEQSLSELEEKVPLGKIGDKEVSRLICGGNLIAGSAHSRGLKYAKTLFKSYNTEKKVFETLILAEQVGINTINVNSGHLPLIYRYRKLFGSNIQVMVQVGTAARDHKQETICEDIDRSIDLGMDFIQIWGASGDYLARNGHTREMGKCLEYAKTKGLPVGIGAHEIHAYHIYREAGLPEPDFYFKTMHHDRYRYVQPRENRVPFKLDGNMWDLFPDKTVDFIQNTKKPVIAFKVLAAGAIPPESGFQYAFDKGADFICVGMFDFQIVEDAKLASSSIRKAKDRSRGWYA